MPCTPPSDTIPIRCSFAVGEAFTRATTACQTGFTASCFSENSLFSRTSS